MLDDKLVHLGGDTKTFTMSIGTSDSNSFEFIANKTIAMVLDKDGNVTFNGTVTFDIVNVNSLSVNTIKTDSTALELNGKFYSSCKFHINIAFLNLLERHVR